jgi:hypothetical protein
MCAAGELLMNRFRLSILLCTATAVSLELLASTAAAQGTMTPSQPPTGTPNQPPPTGTPNQPPPGTPNQPPPVEPAQPAVQPPPPPPKPAGKEGKEGEEVTGEDGAPAARTGFQIAIRPGIAIPAGATEKGANGADDPKLSDYLGPQFSSTVDIGGKIIPNLFIGGYLGLGIGGAGGKASDFCSQFNLSCTGVTLRIGIEGQFHILPDQKINPWVGYGIGYEASSLSSSAKNGNSNNSSSVTRAGIELAHLMGGVDFRISRVFGVGPFLDFSLGQYSSASGSLSTGSSSSSSTLSNDIKDKTLHEWITIGGKVTFFP